MERKLVPTQQIAETAPIILPSSPPQLNPRSMHMTNNIN